MNISAIISEYNPLHKGHMYHIKRTKEITDSDVIICIMSGNYVQRGIPALIDKWNRTKTALQCGIDLVIELPVIYSLSSAEFFSFGAVSLLNSLGVVDNLSFGSEIGDIAFINKISNILFNEQTEFKEKLKAYLSNGFSFPKSRNLALTDFLLSYDTSINASLSNSLNSSNNILGIEYCKSLLRLQSNIKPFTIKREGSSYNDTSLDALFSSATSIRKHIKEQMDITTLSHHMPLESYNNIQALKNNSYNFVCEDSIFPFIKYKSFFSRHSLSNLPDASEGLHNKIYDGLQKTNNYNDLIKSIKSKRYTYTRISRILCQYFVGFENYETDVLRNQKCPYCRVLGFNETGKKVLKLIKQNSEIPIYTKVPKKADSILELDIKATQSYSLINTFINSNDDYLISPIIL